MSAPRRPSAPSGSRTPGRRVGTRPGGTGRAPRPAAAPATAPTPATKPTTKRASKPAVKQANRRGGDRSGRLGGYLPETITTRTLVLSVVVLLVFVLLVPTAREYAKQTAQLNSLQTELTQAQQQRADDTANLKRWDDPAFVKAQARARLGYVMPGEKAYRVTDPGAVAAGVSPATGQAVKPGVVQGTPGDDGAWYQKMWTSVQVAGAGAAGH